MMWQCEFALDRPCEEPAEYVVKVLKERITLFLCKEHFIDYATSLEESEDEE